MGQLAVVGQVGRCGQRKEGPCEICAWVRGRRRGEERKGGRKQRGREGRKERNEGKKGRGWREEGGAKERRKGEMEEGKRERKKEKVDEGLVPASAW